MILVPDPRPPENKHYRVTADDLQKFDVVLVSAPPYFCPVVRYTVTQDGSGRFLEAAADLHSHFELRPKVGVVCPR